MSKRHHERRNEATANLAYAQLPPEDLTARAAEESALTEDLARNNRMAEPIEWLVRPMHELVEWPIV